MRVAFLIRIIQTDSRVRVPVSQVSAQTSPPPLLPSSPASSLPPAPLFSSSLIICIKCVSRWPPSLFPPPRFAHRHGDVFPRGVSWALVPA